MSSHSTPDALRRRFPRVRDLAPLVRFRGPALRREDRLARAADIWDLRTMAARRTPRAPFDYVDGAADLEISLARARAAFRDLEFRPNVLRDVEEVDLSTEVFGRRASMPLGIAPTGFTRMMQSEGEYAGARAAQERGIPFTLSTMGTASVEDVATVAPDGDNWFQLYLWTDRERSAELVRRAAAAGYGTLMVTVDTAVGGDRLRDVRNGMSIPPALGLSTVLDASRRPEWWFDFLTREPLSFASLSRFSGTVSELMSSMFDPTLTLEDLDWLRQEWAGRLVVKGIQSVEDAEAVVGRGVDGIVLSNHGGRQLDRAPVPLHLLPDVVERLRGRTTIILDTGIMHGADVVAALALGADFTLVGRAYLYGLMAGGEQGVQRALEILEAQMRRTMALLGVRSLAELTPQHVSLLDPRARAGVPAGAP